jgi:hypothetical protein
VPESNAADLQRRMAEVREDLERNSARLKENAQTLADWRYYVRRYPWLVVAAAGAVGFLLVPKRAKPAPPSVEALAQLARERGFVLTDASQRTGPSGLLGGLASIVAKTLLRAGTAYVAGQVGQMLAGRMAARTEAAETGNPPVCGVPR